MHSAAPAIIVVCCWNHHFYVNGWSFANRDDILAKSTIVLWIIWFLYFMVSNRRPIYWNSRWTTIRWPLVTSCVTALVSVNPQVSRNICLKIHANHLSFTLTSNVLTLTEANYFKTNACVTDIKYSKLEAQISVNICNICTRMSVHPLFIVNNNSVLLPIQ